MTQTELTVSKKPKLRRLPNEESVKFSLGFDLSDVYGLIFVGSTTFDNVLFGVSFRLWPKFHNWKLIHQRYWNSVFWSWKLVKRRVHVYPVWYINGIKHTGPKFQISNSYHNYVYTIVEDESKLVFAVHPYNSPSDVETHTIQKPKVWKSPQWFLSPYQEQDSVMILRIGVFTP